MKKFLIFLLACLFFCSVVAAQSTSGDDKEFESKITKAFDLVNEEKYDEAEKLLKEAVLLRPSDHRPYAISGFASFEQWKLEEASALFGLAIKFSPDNSTLYYLQALADTFGKSPKDGLAAVRKAIELKPDYADAYLLLGYHLTDPAERKATLSKAVSLDPLAILRFKRLASMAAWKGEDQKTAETIYRMLMEVVPDDTSVRGDLGRLLVKENKLTEARSLWNEHPIKDEQTFPNFITVLERAERLRDAKKAYEASPNDPEMLLRMGIATMEGDSWVVDGRQEKAIVFLKKALKLKPDFAKAQHAICMAYVQMADVFEENNKDVDRELAKLRKMDKKLADDIVEYRRNYSGGIIVNGPPPPANEQ
jgi:tetratricopeptide (TPR) repeat protein